jgi:tRNA G46 methylase TrmB
MIFSLRRAQVGNVVLASLMVVSLATAQTTTGSQQRPTSTPYSGDLSIFEYPDRDKKLQIDRVMDLLGITAGKNVADIGAGSGWFTVRAARRVGPTGAVIAEDINPLAIEYIGKRVVKENLSNVRTVLGGPDDQRLQAGSVDGVLMLGV